MQNEKNRAAARTEQMYKRLKLTPEGTALAGVLDVAGGRIALARALGVEITDVDNWCARGKVSKRGARLIDENSYFNTSKHTMLPALTEFQWMDER